MISLNMLLAYVVGCIATQLDARLAIALGLIGLLVHLYGH